MKEKNEKSKVICLTQELHYNHYSFDDIVTRRKTYNVKHKYCLLKYSFKEDGTKDYIDIITSDHKISMENELKNVNVWEDHVNKIMFFKGKIKLM